jgi:hypothetical protein
MSCKNGRTDPALWERSKKAAKDRACRKSSARCGTWDARMAQDAGRLYREAGGGYCGPRTRTQASMARWTKEDWRTASGRPACERTTRSGTCADRYLPAAAWKKLTPAQRRATQVAKAKGRGQFVPNTPAAKAAGRKARTTRRR